MNTPNGHRRCAPVIVENAFESVESSRLLSTTRLGGCAGSGWGAEDSVFTGGVSGPGVEAGVLGSRDSWGLEVSGSAGGGQDGLAEGAGRAVLLATKLHVPAIGGALVHRGALLEA